MDSEAEYATRKENNSNSLPEYMIYYHDIIYLLNRFIFILNQQ